MIEDIQTSGFIEDVYSGLRKAYEEKERVKVEPRDLLRLLSRSAAMA